MSYNIFLDEYDFLKSLEENQVLNERFKNLMEETFSAIYRAMGEKNFWRWIDERKIYDRIKSLIVEDFNEEEEKKYSSSRAGYYTNGTNRVKLRNNDVSEAYKKTAVHEILHFFTDNKFTGKTFPKFINEGMTEYLTHKIKDKTDYSYIENCKFVFFLHRAVGDSLIKAYLTGTSQEFKEELSTYITEDGTVNTNQVEEFYKILDGIHYNLHPEQAVSHGIREIGVMDSYYPELSRYVMNIITNSIRKKARDLKYYEDGKFLIENVEQEIRELSRLALRPILGGKSILGEISEDESVKIEEAIHKKALTAALEESHIPNIEIENIINSFIIER